MRVNDFVVRFANVNGTGSASANALFTKAVFRMGIPVTPKNIFPSNIQGLPTWYEVRVSEKGYLGRREGIDLMVSVNPQSMKADFESVKAGGYFLYDSSKPLPPGYERDDITHIGIPLMNLCNEAFSDSRQRMLFKNVVYIGALAVLCDIDLRVLEGLVEDQFKKKEHLIKLNYKALQIGIDYVRANFEHPLDLRLERRDLLGDSILIDGNSACGLGAVYAGATVAAWYPITPSTSVVEAFGKYAGKLRIDPATGKKNYAIVQAEDELAAIGMVIGANWNGARSFTATSGPGVSLMNEFLGLAYFAEIPTVLIDVQRTGPSTGMPTRTQQSDILLAAYASHGDTKHVLFFPASPKECFELTAESFDLAEQLQTPVIVMTDLDLGMNDHVSSPLEWDDDRSYKRGKVLDAAALEKIEKYGRYLDVDGDGIAYRTIPGTHESKGAFVARGTSRDEYAVYTEDGDAYRRNMDRLIRKWNTAKEMVPAPEFYSPQRRGDAETDRPGGTEKNSPPYEGGVAAASADGVVLSSRDGVIFFGTSTYAAVEAIELLNEDGIILDAMRVRAFPFGKSFVEFVTAHERIFVIEQNRDAQFKSLMMIELGINPEKLVSVLNYDGTPITADDILNQIKGNLSDPPAVVGG